jgi:hypothetical protein
MKRLLLLVVVVGMLTGCASNSSNKHSAQKPKMLSRAEWNAKPPVAEMKKHTPQFITSHHTATKQKPDVSLADKLRNLQKFSQNEGTLSGGKIKPPWPDVPYHFYIACDGNIGEARDLNYVGDTNTEYDPTGHLLITLEGNFEEEQPTDAQMKSTHQLVGWLAKKYHIAPNKIATHKDYAKTACPGKNLRSQIPEIRAAVKE